MSFPNKDTQFQKGKSGNLKGRPKGPSLSTRVRSLLEGTEKLPDAIGETIRAAVGADRGALDATIIVGLLQALQGNERWAKLLWEYPQKRTLIGLTSRPPQLETPFSVFNENIITPNDAFFVRYHLADVPLDIDPDKFAVDIKGKIDKPMKLSLADIRKMPSVELVAVNQCSGNSRGFFNPRVAVGQLGNGAMGNARWKGVSAQRG